MTVHVQDTDLLTRSCTLEQNVRRARYVALCLAIGPPVKKVDSIETVRPYADWETIRFTTGGDHSQYDT